MHRLLTAILFALTPGMAAAAEQNVIRVYNWNDYIAPQVLVDFEKKTGIRVDYSTFSSAEELDAAVARNEPFDIIVPSNDLLPKLIKEEQVILMPCGSTREELNSSREWVIEQSVKNGWRYSDRLHVVAWDKKTGV